MNFQTRLKKNY